MRASVSRRFEGNKCSLSVAGEERVDQRVDPARVRHVRDLERADSKRAIAEEASEQRLLELEGVDRLQVDRGGAPSSDVPVEHEYLFRRDGEDGAIPQPHCPKRDKGSDREQHRAERGRGGREREAHGAEACEGERARERPDQDEAVATGFEADALGGSGIHRPRASAARAAFLLAGSASGRPRTRRRRASRS
jgi:hypothetical protein